MGLNDVFQEGQKVTLKQCELEVKYVGGHIGALILEAVNGEAEKYFSVGQRYEIRTFLLVIRYIGKDGIVSLELVNGDVSKENGQRKNQEACRSSIQRKGG